jgi:methyl-accepting chemotaxis protein
MTADTERVSYRSGPNAKRKLRNYLLVPAFQLKYTAMVVGVTLIVAGVLGIQAYRYSTGQTQMVTINMMEAKGSAVDDRFVKDLERYSQDADRKVAAGIISGVLLMAIALGITGILVTHRLVGPVFRLKGWVREVKDGRLRIDTGRLRKHDELQDLFESFHDMVVSWRAIQEREIAQLDAAIDEARTAGIPDSAIGTLTATRDRMRSKLD